MAITLIQTVTVGSGGAASIDFTSIPGTYTDLMVVHSTRTADAGTTADTVIQFNGDTGANYSFRRLNGNGSSASSDSGSSNALYGLSGVTSGNTSTSNTFGNIVLYIPNYTSSQTKSWSVDSVAENNASAATLNINACVWSGTAAITSIKLRAYSGANLAQYSSATLYGILKGSSGGVTVS